MKQIIKKIIIILSTIFILFFAIGCFGMLYLTHGLHGMEQINISGIDLSEVSDGTYIGSFNEGRFSNSIEVTVANHKIVNLTLLDDVLFPKPGVSDELFHSIITSQNTTVDAISGATLTSKAYIKSIENIH
jgi:uncharacterized protein with FMN-binding domain